MQTALNVNHGFEVQRVLFGVQNVLKKVQEIPKFANLLDSLSHRVSQNVVLLSIIIQCYK